MKNGDIILFKNGAKNPTILEGTIVNIDGKYIDLTNVKTMDGKPVEDKWCYTDQVVGIQETLL